MTLIVWLWFCVLCTELLATSLIEKEVGSLEDVKLLYEKLKDELQQEFGDMNQMLHKHVSLAKERGVERRTVLQSIEKVLSKPLLDEKTQLLYFFYCLGKDAWKFLVNYFCEEDACEPIRDKYRSVFEVCNQELASELNKTVEELFKDTFD